MILNHGIYPMPIGKGLAMVDARDIGEIAALELARREQASKPLPLERIDVVGPETLTGSDIARIWMAVLDDADVRHRLLRATIRRSGSVQDD